MVRTVTPFAAYASEVRAAADTWRRYVEHCTEAGKHPNDSPERAKADAAAAKLRHERGLHTTRLRALLHALDAAILKGEA
jgi:hypothetical protein